MKTVILLALAACGSEPDKTIADAAPPLPDSDLFTDRVDCDPLTWGTGTCSRACRFFPQEPRPADDCLINHPFNIPNQNSCAVVGYRVNAFDVRGCCVQRDSEELLVLWAECLN